MGFRLLGRLEVVRDGRSVLIGSGKQRALLGLLLLHPNEVVSRDRLIDELCVRHDRCRDGNRAVRVERERSNRSGTGCTRRMTSVLP
jgi:DNA-binding response OmpR family regulator